VLGNPMDATARQAADALDDVARLRERTRRSLGVPWFPLVCFGLLTMLSTPLLAGAGTAALLPLWLVAGAAGMLLTGCCYYRRRRGRRRGVTGRGRRVWAVAAFLFLACLAGGIAGGMTGGEAGGVLATIVIVVAGYFALGLLQHNLAAALALTPGRRSPLRSCWRAWHRGSPS
jgi:drug/metabolite transporter (DMT)-like permease